MPFSPLIRCRNMARLANAKKLTHDQLIERWTDWLKQTEKSSFHLYRSRYTWENIQRLFEANPPLQTDASHILEWMHHNFWNEHAIAVRKEMEHGKGISDADELPSTNWNDSQKLC